MVCATSSLLLGAEHLAGIDITADRLFGPLPRTTTYVCIWEIRIGAVKTVISARDAAILSAAGNAFRLNFVDASNAPAAEHIVPEPPDGKPDRGLFK